VKQEEISDEIPNISNCEILVEISSGILNCEISGDLGAWGFAGVEENFDFD
jgi:hypothetical protein